MVNIYEKNQSTIPFTFKRHIFAHFLLDWNFLIDLNAQLQNCLKFQKQTNHRQESYNNPLISVR